MVLSNGLLGLDGRGSETLNPLEGGLMEQWGDETEDGSADSMAGGFGELEPVRMRASRAWLPLAGRLLLASIDCSRLMGSIAYKHSTLTGRWLLTVYCLLAWPRRV
jgi:hypothetical protein